MFAIKNIKLNNFRSYNNKMYEFSDKINVLYGANAVGKTSVLEAIAYLGLCKSFRGAKDKDVIKNDQSFFFVKGEFSFENEIKDEIIISFDGKDKKIKKNNYFFQKVSDFFGYFNVVTFEPVDLNLVKGGPIERRKFLDVNISQYNKEYMVSIMRFNKILKKRNEFLKSIEELTACNVEYLDSIDELFAKEAIRVIENREKFVKELNEEIKRTSFELSLGNEEVSVEYKPSEKVENFVKNLKNKRKYDMISQSTSLGPHRDDVLVRINGKEAENYASQGQIRTAVIALKLGLATYLRKYNEKQIILLDDVFSELDKDRQNRLLELLNGKSQIFITTTSVSNINEEIKKQSKLIEVTKENEI